MKSVPKTLHLLTRRWGGGTETNVHRLVESVEDFELAALEDSLGWPFDWRRLPRALAGLRTLRPEVVFCYGATAHLIAFMAWPLAVPLIGNIRCESDFAEKKGVLRKILRKRFAVWVSNSRMALKGESGIVIYNGVNPPRFENPLFTNLPKPVFGMLARGHAKKRHDFALDLWENLHKPGTLIFAGELPSALQKKAVSKGVLCPGFVDPGPFLRSIDMLWMPSDAEGIPTAMLEAMARGVPCLATPVGGIPELAAHGETALIAERDQWQSILQSQQWEEWREIGRAGQRHVLKYFTFQRMRSRFIAVSRRAVRREKTLVRRGVAPRL